MDRITCPDCGSFPHQYGQSIKTTTGRKRSRKCVQCNRRMVTHQVTGEPERFVRWVASASPEQRARFERLRLSFELAEMPPKFFQALARVQSRLGI